MSANPQTPTAIPPGRAVRVGMGTAVALTVVNLLLVTACIAALRQNVRLRSALAFDVALLTPANGSILPPLIGQDPAGNPQTIIYGVGARPTLVYTFTKECGYCQENWRAMRSLQALSPRQLRIVYIDTQHDTFTAQYLDAEGIRQSALLAQLSPRAEYTYNARAVPQAILVGRDGRVQWSHVGELGPGDISKVLSLIEHD